MPHALILGPTGRYGRHVKAAFEAAGWTTKAFVRSRDILAHEARAAQVIAFGWNPGYQNWEGQARLCLAEALRAAEAADATLLFPGNVYVYGEGSPEILSPETPHGATNKLGKIRVEMEQMLAASSAQVIVLRAGDFLDTQRSGNWFDRVIVGKLGKGRIEYPSAVADAPHAFAYLPDYARASVMLAEKRAHLDRFTTLNFPGYTLTGQEIADQLGVRFTSYNWFFIHILSYFYLFAHGLIELRYLWSMPHRLDGQQFQDLLPDFTPTPLADGLRHASLRDVDPNKPVVTGLSSAGV